MKHKRVLAVVMALMMVIAFMPSLTFAAKTTKAVKPVKVTVKSAKQVTNTMKVKVTWKKAKNAKTYNIKIDKKVVKKGLKKLNYTSANLKAGKHKVYVRGVNGKKLGKWSKAKSFKILDKAAASVFIDGEAIVGETLTANVYNKAGDPLTSGVTYQWWRVNNFTGVVAEIAGATQDTYTITAADLGTFGEGGSVYQIFVVAKAWGKTVTSEKTDAVVAGYYVQMDMDQADTGGEIVPVGIPFVGQRVYTDIFDSVYNQQQLATIGKYQWYIDGVAMRGATHEYFDITADELGKTLECVVTVGDKEYTTGLFVVEESKMPTKVEIKGASGLRNGQYSVPAVGDELAAVFTEPEGATDPDATYQWYSGRMALKGETNPTYKVKKEDIGSTIWVVVTLSNGKELDPAETDAVVANVLNDKAYTAVVVDPANPKNTVFTPGTIQNPNRVQATVYENSDPQKTDIRATVSSDNGTVWYIDSIAPENQLWVTNYWGNNTHAVTDYNISLSGRYGTTTDGTAATFKRLDADDQTRSLVGHTLIAVVNGNNETYAGSVTALAIGPVCMQIAAPSIEPNGANAEGQIVVGKTTLKTKFDDEDTTATYQWYKSTDAGLNYKAIAGATSANYKPTSEDAYEKVNKYKVVVKGSGDYVGEEFAEFEAAFADSSTKIAVNISIYNEDGKKVTTGTARPGAVLTAAGDVDAAEDTMTYEWKYTDVSAGTTATAKGATYTVPANAENPDTVQVTATNTDTNYYPLNPAPVLTVSTVAIKSVTLTSTDAAGEKADPANPVRGDTFTAAVDPANADYYNLQWYYADDPDTPIENATSATYRTTSEDLGRALTVVATGEGDYAGTSASATTGVVKVKVNVVAFRDNQRITNETLLNVGDKITVRVQRDGTTNRWHDGAVTAWNWTTNGSIAPEDNVYTIQNADIDGDEISITVEGPFTDDSTLTWTYRGTINQEDNGN